MKRIYNTIRLRSTDSTNNEAKKRPLSDNLTVITAFGQTAGRGQRGNSWHSTPGMNLTFSILLRWGRDGVPGMQAAEQFAVSQIAALSLIDFLVSKGIEAKVKWPNDIYVGDRKICGILIEHTVSGTFLSSSVIGIGLNVNETDFPHEIPNPTSLRGETGKEYDTDRCLEEFIACFDSRLSDAETPEGRTLLDNIYLEHLYRKDEPHRYIDLRGSGQGISPVNAYFCDNEGRTCGNEGCTCGNASNHRGLASGAMFTGIIRGVSPTACLLVETEEGGLLEFAFKEIAYVI